MNSQRKTRRQELMKKQIIEAALDVVDLKGVENLTMEDVAHRLGCSVGTLYNYFPSKERLLLEMFISHGDEIGSVLKVELPKSLHFEEALGWYVREILKIFHKRRRVMLFLFSGRLAEMLQRVAPLFGKEMKNKVFSQIDRLAAVIGKWLPDDFTTLPPKEVAWTIAALVRTTLFRDMLENREKELDFDEVARRIVRIALWGAYGFREEKNG